MEVPFLGKTYAYDILKTLGKEKFTFSGLLKQMKVSRTTLNKTLQTLMAESYVSRENIGRYTIYRITEKGLQILQPDSNIKDLLSEHLTDYILKKLQEKKLLEKYEIDKKVLTEEIQVQTQKFLEEIIRKIQKSIEEGM